MRVAKRKMYPAVRYARMDISYAHRVFMEEFLDQHGLHARYVESP